MLHFHQMNGLGHTLRLIPIYRIGPARGHGAKTTTAGTYISKNHKCGRACAPALAHVGAVTTFANGMKFMCVNQVAYMLITFANG